MGHAAAEITLQIAIMLAAMRLRHQQADIASQHLVAAVAEAGAGGLVERGDQSFCVDHHHAVEHAIQHCLQMPGQIFQAVFGLMLEQGHRHRRIQLAGGKRFENIAIRLGQLGAGNDRFGIKGGQEHHRQVILPAQDVGCSDAVEGASQLDVHQDQIRKELCSQLDGLLGRGTMADRLIAQLKQLLLQVAHDDRLVFNDQDARHGSIHAVQADKADNACRPGRMLRLKLAPGPISRLLPSWSARSATSCSPSEDLRLASKSAGRPMPSSLTRN